MTGMRGLAGLAMRGPLVAALTIAAFALVALVFAPALLASGALVGLVTLRHGPGAGLRTIATSAALVAGALLLLNGRLGLAAIAIAAAWGVVWGAALTLRRTGQQGHAIVSLGLCVMAYAAMMRWRTPDVNRFWQARLRILGELVEAEGGQFLTAEQIEVYGAMMHAASVALLFVGFAGMLLLARGWQAGLYNPGGFRAEFHALALPRWVSSLGALVALASIVGSLRGTKIGLAEDAVIVLVLMVSLQGLAVLHAACAAKALSRVWLVGTYVLLGLVPQVMVPILATTGLADMVVDLRRRLRAGRHDEGPEGGGPE